MEEIRASSLQAALNLLDAANIAINSNENAGKRYGSLMFIVYLYRYKQEEKMTAGTVVYVHFILVSYSMFGNIHIAYKTLQVPLA